MAVLMLEVHRIGTTHANNAQIKQELEKSVASLQKEVDVLGKRQEVTAWPGAFFKYSTIDPAHPVILRPSKHCSTQGLAKPLISKSERKCVTHLKAIAVQENVSIINVI